MATISDRPVTPAQLRSIHVAKARAGLDDAEYRALLDRRYGCSSAKSLTRAQASELLTSFGRPLPQPPGQRRRRQRKPAPPANVVALATAPQRKLIETLRGAIQWRSPDGYRQWLRANQGIDRVRTAAEASRCIEGLKRMGR